MALFKLEKDESIIAIRPENAVGPGWSNSPLWVIIMNSNGGLRKECLQPHEQSDNIRLLFDIGEKVDSELINEIYRMLHDNID